MLGKQNCRLSNCESDILGGKKPGDEVSFPHAELVNWKRWEDYLSAKLYP